MTGKKDVVKLATSPKEEALKKYLDSVHVYLRYELAAVARILAIEAGVPTAAIARYAIAKLALEYPDIKKILLKHLKDENIVDRILLECAKEIENIGKP